MPIIIIVYWPIQIVKMNQRPIMRGHKSGINNIREIKVKRLNLSEGNIQCTVSQKECTVSGGLHKDKIAK